MALFVCSFLRSEYLCQSTHILSAKKLPKLSLKDFVHDLAFSKDGSMLSAAGAGEDQCVEHRIVERLI